METADMDQARLAEPDGADADGEDWLLVMDPRWEAKDEVPPFEAIMGVWPLGPDGRTGKFRANPKYTPADPDEPSDPIDAQLRAILTRDAEPGRLRLLLRDSLVDVALNGDGRPLVIESPDDRLCAVVTTSEPHRMRVGSPSWRRVDIDGLLEVLTEFDNVLLNPGGPAAVRVIGDFLRGAAALTDEQAVAEYERYAESSGEPFPVLRWETGLDDDPAAPERPDEDDSRDNGNETSAEDAETADSAPPPDGSEFAGALARLSTASTPQVDPAPVNTRRPGMRRRRDPQAPEPTAAPHATSAE